MIFVNTNMTPVIPGFKGVPDNVSKTWLNLMKNFTFTLAINGNK